MQATRPAGAAGAVPRLVELSAYLLCLGRPLRAVPVLRRLRQAWTRWRRGCAALTAAPAHAHTRSIEQCVCAQFGGPEEIYDVYVNQPELLDEGVEKHVISVFVADESGIINRVAGVFARRGAQLQALADV